MTSFFDLTIGEIQQFHVALHNGGLTAELVKKIGNNADLGNVMVEALIAHLEPSIPCASDTQMGPLPLDHYRIHVNRGRFPSMEVLQEQFSKGGVSDLYNGKYEWKKHSCRSGKKDVTAKNVIMVVKQFTAEEIKEMGGLESENIIAWGLKNGLVPADVKETYAFGVNPETHDLQCQFWMVGLGSFTMRGGERCASLMGVSGGVRVLGRCWYDDSWHSDLRFLFVRK